MNLELRIEREASTTRSTPGVLYVDGVRECFTLEDPVREKRYDDGSLIPVRVWKIPGATAIPSGRYPLVLDWSLRFGRVMPHILGVPGFSAIRIHPGNVSENTEGCPLTGRIRFSKNEVRESQAAFDALMEKLLTAAEQERPMYITIENPRAADGAIPP